jgi:hypothetical protein
MKTKPINPKFKCNTVSVSLSASNPISVIVSLKEERNKETKKKRVWRQLCERLSEAAAHLQPAAAAGFIYADLRSEVYTHLALQAMFVQSSPGHMPFSFLQYTALPACCNCSLFFYYLEFTWGCVSLPLSSEASHTLAAITGLTLSKHTGGGAATPAFSHQLVYLQFV